jgi:hypothetical protein
VKTSKYGQIFRGRGGSAAFTLSYTKVNPEPKSFMGSIKRHAKLFEKMVQNYMIL